MTTETLHGHMHATSVRTDDDGFHIVRYHDTDIVRFNATTVELDTGGWFTATTKRRMNQTANSYGLNYRVYQRNGNWYVDHRGGVSRFNGQTMIFSRTVYKTA